MWYEIYFYVQNLPIGLNIWLSNQRLIVEVCFYFSCLDSALTQAWPWLICRRISRWNPDLLIIVLNLSHSFHTTKFWSRDGRWKTACSQLRKKQNDNQFIKIQLTVCFVENLISFRPVLMQWSPTTAPETTSVPRKSKFINILRIKRSSCGGLVVECLLNSLHALLWWVKISIKYGVLIVQ